MKQIIIGILTLLLALSCNNKPTNQVKEDSQETKEQVVTVEKKQEPSVDKNENSSSIPAYLNVDLLGYGVPNTNLANFYGEVIFVNYWATWCPPCRREMPSIQDLYNKYGSKVKFVTVAFEKRPGKLQPFINKNRYTFPVYEAKSPLMPEMKTRAYPTTFIINKKGEIKVKDVGAADWNSPKVHELLDKLLAE